MRSEDSILQGLGCHPPDRKQPLTALPIVVGLIDVSRHAKVCHETIDSVVLDQHIPEEKDPFQMWVYKRLKKTFFFHPQIIFMILIIIKMYI